MITAIVIDECGQSHIRRYQTDNPREARDEFVVEWINGGIVWEHFEYNGPNCRVDNPAFTPDFLRKDRSSREPVLVEQGVTIYEWLCITGPHGSDEHSIIGYFIPSKDGSAAETAGGSEASELNNAKSALANDGVFLLRLCSRLEHAIQIRNEERTYCFKEAVRVLAAAILEPEDSREISTNGIMIEADLQMKLWDKALLDCRHFTDAIRQAIQKTARRN